MFLLAQNKFLILVKLGNGPVVAIGIKSFVFGDLTKYSPSIIPSARSTIRQIAQSLGDCPDEKAREFLLALQNICLLGCA